MKSPTPRASRAPRKPAPVADAPPAPNRDDNPRRALSFNEARGVNESIKAMRGKIDLAEVQRRAAEQQRARGTGQDKPAPGTPAAAPAKRGRGRPAIPSEQWKVRVLDGIAAGGMLTELCRQDGWPSRQRIYEWFAEDAEFHTNYRTIAREIGSEAIAERALSDARSATDAGLGRLAWNAATWYISKTNARRYGDRVAVSIEEKPLRDMTDEELDAVISRLGSGKTSTEDGAA